jgi:uncharacterized repeat protein (TIGR03803 family)
MRNLNQSAVSLTALLLFVHFIITPPSLRAQTFSVLHSFSGGPGGTAPEAGLTIDRAGNLYGTTSSGGQGGSGMVFKLARSGEGWVLSPLYQFGGGPDGRIPIARVVFGPDGKLYGTTQQGGNLAACGGVGCGVVFNLTPRATACKTSLCSWSETVLHAFTNAPDGSYPSSELTFDSSGNLFGTSFLGGTSGCSGLGSGTVYELSPSHGSWTESIIYSFSSGPGDGCNPRSNVVFDGSGNLYGTTWEGGAFETGSVYELTSTPNGWTGSILHSFPNNNDSYPYAGLTLDSSGKLYGATAGGYVDTDGGAAFQLSSSNGGWTYSSLYAFGGEAGCGPHGNLTLDANGNLYGATYCSGTYERGSIFKLVRTAGGWAYTSLHDFSGGVDGGCPIGPVILDSAGNLYGTAQFGGTADKGTVWEITP